MPAPDRSRLERLALLALALALVVVVVSAAIRIGLAHTPPLAGGGLLALRGLHRLSASLDALAIIALAWFAWRVRLQQPRLARAALAALVLTLMLSALGIATGTAPPPAAAYGNLLGGLALAASLAWARGALQERVGIAPRVVRASFLLIVAQCLLGAWLAVLSDRLWSWPLALHALLGTALSLLCIATGQACAAQGQRRRALALWAAAALAPLTGALAAVLDLPPAASLAHALLAALLLAGFAALRARIA